MDPQAALNLAEQRVKEYLPNATTINWQQIIAAMISALMGGCLGPTPAPAAVSAACAKPNLHARLNVARQLSNQGIAWCTPFGQQCMGAVLNMGAGATADEISGFITYAQSHAA